MVFSSTFFLFGFLPVVTIFYYAQRLFRHMGLRNATLLFFSYLFYLYGAADFLLTLIMSTFVDYLIGLLIDRDPRHKRVWLCISVVLNLGLLSWFKYANFFVENINALLAAMNLSTIEMSPVHLPLGISFFTFQALSYVVDVYLGRVAAQKRFINLALYISLFPQLIAAGNKLIPLIHRAN